MMNSLKYGILVALLLMTGCAIEPMQTSSKNSYSYSGMQQPKNSFINANYQAADGLHNTLKQRSDISKNAPILVATLVNIDTLTESSRLGRIISEQLQARLSQHGYSVVELKIRDNLFVKKDQGELLLSREIQDMTISHKAQAVVVGTYAIASDNVFINLKVVGANNIVISSYDYSMTMDADIRTMLGNVKRY